MEESEKSSAAEVPSPCIGLCEIEPGSGLCIGCQRTLSEVVRWPQLGAAARRQVLVAVAQRRAADSATG